MDNMHVRQFSCTPYLLAKKSITQIPTKHCQKILKTKGNYTEALVQQKSAIHNKRKLLAEARESILKKLPSSSKTVESLPKTELQDLTGEYEKFSCGMYSYAKQAPITEGTIDIAEDGKLVQTIAKQQASFQIGTCRIWLEGITIEMLLDPVEEHIAWERHDTETGESLERVRILGKRIMPDGRIESRPVKEEQKIRKHESLRSVLEPVGNPFLINGLPARQDFQEIHYYSRPGDMSEYIRRNETQTRTLPISMKHKKFEHGDDRSYQIVDCFASPDGQEIQIAGLANYRLSTSFMHREMLEPGKDASKRILKIYFDRENAVDSGKISPEEEIVRRDRCSQNGWQHDDNNLRSYKIFRIDETNRDITSNDYTEYNLDNNKIRLLPQNGTLECREDGTPFRQTCIPERVYTRADGTRYYNKEASFSAEHFVFEHIGFIPRAPMNSDEYFQPGNEHYAYQLVRIMINYEGRLRCLHDNYEVRGRKYFYEVKPNSSSWVDDKKQHKSYKYEEIYINTIGALGQERAEGNFVVIAPRQKTQEENHVQISVTEKIKHPLSSYRVPRSGEFY